MAEAAMDGGVPPKNPPSSNLGEGNSEPENFPVAGVPDSKSESSNLPKNISSVSTGMGIFTDWFNDMLKKPSVKRALPAIIIMFLLLLAAAILQFSQTTPYRTIMPGMTENDKQAAIEALKAGGFSPKIDSTSGQITVPESRYHESRIFLAGQGIPKEAQPLGMESLKDQSSMTTSQFMEQVQYNSAIEQELARTIMQISTIKEARVHLALPKQSVFVRERATPKASVVVTPHSGRGVATPQVKAIVHLVSSSVPYLTPENVSVVDDLGNLMTTENIVDLTMGLTVAQMAHKQRTEENYRQRVTELLAPVVGNNAVRAEVNLTLNYTTVETTTEDFDNNDKGVKPRSEALTTERKYKIDPEGIPGALANAPPPDADLTTDTNVNETSPVNNEIVTTKATRNFEIDRTVRTVKNPMGSIERVSVAVVVAERQAPPPADGAGFAPGAITTIPYTDEELDRMLQLVRSAVGFNEARGDIVTVAPARFESLAAAPPIPWYSNTDIQNFIKIGIAALVMIVFLLAVVRPMVKGPTINQIMPPDGPSEEDVKAAEALRTVEITKAVEEAKAAEVERMTEEIKEAEVAKQKAEEEEEEARALEEAELAAQKAEEEDEEEVDEESIEEMKEQMKAMKPKKPTFSADMLDTANSYDDKVALIRMLVSQESGRVAMVLKNMVKE
tara:strand:- start:141 stop:2162 length:2022 start_codon:yes stop_codon:yes gene_type:complete